MKTQQGRGEVNRPDATKLLVQIATIGFIIASFGYLVISIPSLFR